MLQKDALHAQALAIKDESLKHKEEASRQLALRMLDLKDQLDEARREVDRLRGGAKNAAAGGGSGSPAAAAAAAAARKEPTQKGAVAAYHLDSSAVEAMRDEFQARRDLIIGLLRQIPGLKVFEPQGAFYVLPDITAFLGGELTTDIELAAWLLEEAKVATVPGTVFEGAGHLRLSYAASRADIEKGVGRIAEALAKRNA